MHLSLKRVAARLSFLLTPLILATSLLQSCATGDLRATPDVHAFQLVDGNAYVATPGSGDRFSVMTLNVAHGRGDSFHQLLQGSGTTLTNLDTVSAVLKTIGADVVALQEADGPSFWSGNFDHVEYLAIHGEFTRAVRAAHVDALGLSYGTALLANREMQDARAITFDPALSLVPKGFVVSTVTWPGKPCLEIDVVSVHLDFASDTVRQRQAQELIGTLVGRNRPTILMGDFNADWHEQNSTVRYIAERLELVAYAPESRGLETFPAFDKRLDWILVSPEFEFQSYQVIPDVVSDHRGVHAVLTLRDNTKLQMATLTGTAATAFRPPSPEGDHRICG